MWVRRYRSLMAVAALAAVILITGGGDSRAAVTVELSQQGEYVRTLIVSKASVSRQHVWTTFDNDFGLRALNPLGDLNGDLWPAIIEDPTSGYHPWLVWSRFNGRDYDLGWSRWTAEGWRKIDWVEERSRLGDDLDPNLQIDTGGRPYVAWWTDEGGVGRIYFSMYLDSRWMSGRLVSDQITDSRYPSMKINEDGSVIVTFDTPEGPQSKIVAVASGISINDDLDPVNNLTVEEFRPKSNIGN